MNMEGFRVGLGINRHGFDPQFLTGPNYPQCYFASIGYENLIKHAYPLMPLVVKPMASY
jgi:hypothetical protein